MEVAVAIVVGTVLIISILFGSGDEVNVDCGHPSEHVHTIEELEEEQ